VRITHIPSGTVAYCAQTRSQYENRQRAEAELSRRITESKNAASAKRLNDHRASQAIAERSSRVFTWNVQRGTVVDHATGRSWRLKDFARGKIS